MNNTDAGEWKCVPYDDTVSAALASALDLPLAIGKVLVGRGIHTEAAARAYLNPALSQLTDPFSMPGITVALKRVLQAIDQSEQIVVYGDYDCDGVVATTLLVDVLRKLGAEVAYFIPQRVEDGFGFTLGALDRVLEEMHPRLIITADCGMRSADAVDKASQAGVDTIIIDHHFPYGSPFPSSLAVISSIDENAPSSMQSLASVGLAFVLCRALCSTLDAGSEIDMWHYLDLVTIGTITDLMPLTGDNRILTHFGLQLLNDVRKRRPGILALLRMAGLRTELGSYEVGFLVGPRVSAAGRVGDASVAVGLLLETDPMEARRFSGRLEACYRERRRIEEGVMQDALAAAQETIKEQEGVIVAVGSGWHIGTIGIVAARISGRYNRPVVVITNEGDGKARGSCRSVSGVDLEKVLTHCSEYLLSYGGHGFVAGFALETEHIAAFCEAFRSACKRERDPALETGQYDVDAWIDLSEADAYLLDSIKQLQPLGVGNQTPVWGARHVRIQGPPKIVGGNHLKCTIVSGNTQCDAIGYGLGDLTVPEEPLDICFQLQRNHYRGVSRLQLSLKSMRHSVAS